MPMGLRKEVLIDQASDYVETVRPQVEAAVGTAVVAAMDAAKEAKDRAIPLIADAREKAGPALTDAVKKAGQEIADARDKAAPIPRGAARSPPRRPRPRPAWPPRRLPPAVTAAARVAQLKGEPPPKKRGGTLKKILLVTGLAAVAAFAAKQILGRGKADNWQSSYVPTPAPPAQRRAVHPGEPGCPDGRSGGRRHGRFLARRGARRPGGRQPRSRRRTSPPRSSRSRTVPRANATTDQQYDAWAVRQYDVNGAGRRRDPSAGSALSRCRSPPTSRRASRSAPRVPPGSPSAGPATTA